VRKAGATPLEFFELCMQNVKVNSLHTGGSGGEDRLTEQIDLTGVIFSMRYTPQNADGTPGTAMRAGFDFSQNPAQPVTAGC
jgi:type VI secretion system secreted protein Hcp